ncbi:MAG: ribonuclease HII, partial [Algicola sp.]|nr:ribonuclease HII [Algicola sp.]
TLAVLSDNKLTIKTNTVNLDFGNYTAPKIFYIYDKIYVTVTDLQAKKVYVFDSQAKPIKNFPIYGNSSIEMDDIDNDKSIEVIVKGDDKSIIIYEIN